ncbi:hypothetical protein [Microlunatus flavus]|uniref:hypothetical protein n=1 Tax=Microlunatus flavus TaxID=1036181 RepID=UPI001113F766|nr:hypothetical protein [Microlunatus flavus]
MTSELFSASDSTLMSSDGRVRPTEPLTPVASRQTAVPLEGRERIAWRLAALTLVLRSCRGRSATLEQLHVLLWALRDHRNAQVLQQRWEHPDNQNVLRAYDPRLDDTLSLAKAVGLVGQLGTGRIVLSELGGRVADRVRGEEGLMEDERQTLAALGSISEAAMWRRLGTPEKRGAA